MGREPCQRRSGSTAPTSPRGSVGDLSALPGGPGKLNNQRNHERMKLLLNNQLATAGAIAQTLRVPAGSNIRLKGELRGFQGWLDKIARQARKR